MSIQYNDYTVGTGLCPELLDPNSGWIPGAEVTYAGVKGIYGVVVSAFNATVNYAGGYRAKRTLIKVLWSNAPESLWMVMKQPT